MLILINRWWMLHPIRHVLPIRSSNSMSQLLNRSSMQRLILPRLWLRDQPRQNQIVQHYNRLQLVVQILDNYSANAQLHSLADKDRTWWEEVSLAHHSLRTNRIVRMVPRSSKIEINKWRNSKNRPQPSSRSSRSYKSSKKKSASYKRNWMKFHRIKINKSMNE